MSVEVYDYFMSVFADNNVGAILPEHMRSLVESIAWRGTGVAFTAGPASPDAAGTNKVLVEPAFIATPDVTPIEPDNTFQFNVSGWYMATMTVNFDLHNNGDWVGIATYANGEETNRFTIGNIQKDTAHSLGSSRPFEVQAGDVLEFRWVANNNQSIEVTGGSMLIQRMTMIAPTSIP